MKISVCHYSFHRTWKEEGWDCLRLAEEVKKINADAIDFHAKLLGDPNTAVNKIKDALAQTGLQLSGLSMSNNFNQEDPAALKEQLDNVKTWLGVAAEVQAPVSRIFGGGGANRNDPENLQACLNRVTEALHEIVKEAEKLGVVLALENHGGLPCTGEEQVEAIKNIGSEHLKATVDVGNYMQGGQEGHVGTEIAAPYAAYIHIKDFRKKNPGNPPWNLEPCTIGEGDVDLKKCLLALKNNNYDGYLAIEYEGTEDEMTGVPKSLNYIKQIIGEI